MKKSTRTAAALLERVARPIDGSRPSAPRNLVVLGYHRIDNSEGGLSVRLDHFRAHLDWIQAEGLRVVSLDEDEVLAPDATPRLALTFDDGYASVAESAWPELKARGWPAMVYAVPGYLGGNLRFPWDAASEERSARLMDASLLRELADDGMVVGSHTVTHRYLPGLTPREARAEIRDSRWMLEDVLGRAVGSFSYPMGGFNRRLRGLVAGAGYRTAVTVLRGTNRGNRDPLTLRRPIVESDPDDFARIVRGYFDFLRPLDWVRERSRQWSAYRHRSTAPDRVGT